jgi:HAD superfamily hydrolase (TIGR01509 family)
LIEAKTLKETTYRAQLHKIGVIESTLAIIKHYYGKKPIAIATGSSRTGADKVLSALGLQHYFQTVSTSDDVKNHKPAPDVFIHAAEQLNIEPKLCVAFEDTDIGLQSIKAAGMHAVDVNKI